MNTHKTELLTVFLYKDEVDEVEAYRGKWANLHIHRSGKTGLGELRYDSAESADKNTAKVMALRGLSGIATSAGIFRKDDIVDIFPIPVSE